MTDQPHTEPTPGPWKYSDIDNGNFRIYAPDGRGAQSGPVAEAMHRFDPDERRANARLIAAAPDTAAERDRLIEALIEIEGSGSCYCPRDVDGQRLGCKCSICVARAALAEARGA